MGFLRVGVTGGIGSGKSTVCRLFEQIGRSVVYADDIARSLAESDPEIRQEIMRAFGTDVYRPNGSLDRGKLAGIAFSNKRSKQRLDRIVHPSVFEEIDRHTERIALKGTEPYVLIEAALIFETRMDVRLDRVLVVTAPEELRIKRVVKRDGTSRKEVVSRMRAQLPQSAITERADIVIENSRDMNSLTDKVHFIDRLLTTLVKT